MGIETGKLVELITEDLRLLKELHQTLLDEQQAIANLDSGRMDGLNMQKEQLAAMQRKIAEQLRVCLVKAATGLGLPPEARLTEIITKLTTAQKMQLEPLQSSLRGAAAAVAEVAEQNRGMLERFLGVVNDSLGFLTRVLNSSSMYGSNGMYRTEQTSAMILNREA